MDKRLSGEMQSTVNVTAVVENQPTYRQRRTPILPRLLVQGQKKKRINTTASAHYALIKLSDAVYKFDHVHFHIVGFLYKCMLTYFNA